ncbi:MAG: hypothetical protein ACYDDW_15565, partial [Dermatophilaceae bacterium]
AVDGEAGLEAPKDVPAVVVLPAAGAVRESPHAVNVTHAVSSRPPITGRAELAIADSFPPRPVPPAHVHCV